MSASAVLVTGGTGFIGSPLVRALSRAGHTVTAVTQPGRNSDSECLVVEADLLDERGIARVAELRPDVAVLAAWCAEPPGYLTSTENLRWVSSTLQLAQTLLAQGCRRIVGVGTCFEYDGSLGYLNEASKIHPQTLYAACKAATYGVLRELSAIHGASFAWARIFFQYGPREHVQRLVASTIRALLLARRAPLTTGDHVRDYLHVEDVGAALAAIVLSDARGPINIGSGQPVTVREVAEAIGDACGRRELLGFGDIQPRPSDPPFVCANAEHLRELGWRPRFTLADGIADTVDWWRAHVEER